MNTNFNAKNPIILVNFKTFRESTGENALRLAKNLQESAVNLKLQIGLCVQSINLREIVQNIDCKVLAQHIDAVAFGSHTGATLPEAIKEAGASGSLVNHSEKRIPLDEIEKVVMRMREVGLVSVVCVENLTEAKSVAEFKPDFIAIEPPELIGGDISVSTAKPELISEAVTVANGIPLLVGAGIKNGEDLRIALSLGASGILIASGLCKAKNPVEVLEDFANNIG